MCQTWDDEEKVVASLPDLEFVRWVSHRLWVTRQTGTAVQFEKSRRMFVSWIRSSCRLHYIGLGKATGLIAGETYAKAAQHVWRLSWLYKHLPKAWDLPGVHELGTQEGGYAEQRIRSLTLANGSLVQAVNQDETVAQGSGKSFIDLEELSNYPYAAAVWSHSYIILHGRPDSVGGHLVGVSNTNGENEGWLGLLEVEKVIENNDPTDPSWMESAEW